MFFHVLDYTQASTTEPYQANFLDKDLLPSLDNTTYTHNIVELLVYWTQMARRRSELVTGRPNSQSADRLRLFGP